MSQDTGMFESIKTHLMIRGVEQTLVDRTFATILMEAIDELRKDHVLPYTKIDFQVVTRKDEWKIGDDLMANYIRMPDDFYELVQLDIKGSTVYTKYEQNYRQLIEATSTNRNLFSIDRHTVESGNDVLALFMNPFPGDETYITLEYVAQGDPENWDSIDMKFLPAIRQKVLNKYGVAQSDTVEVAVAKVKSNVQDPAGNKMYNRPTKIKGKFFGKTSI